MPYYHIPHTEALIWLRSSRRLEPAVTLPPWRLVEEPEPEPSVAEPEDEPEGWS